mmetsp:Transcript_5181/g.14579  ORF Transcript_5181/g.14579 Transcript_5181/m.14579 type:complete len:290 (-) Transcript_5181:227-1096(-)|eukprot:CAMPEP_0119135294 /NCGR_PEP_ID=MMETSP1310-20130426/18998_1 /TAXON_ID=464262 /ORGANISM="Genus nov. species nov., Strain RCC2339" /LENGTH=289 /DNA_ID=CAMNT_0007126165 /DNA_START=47 /DNA_END=916 /DNA_ORIENTATION=+
MEEKGQVFSVAYDGSDVGRRCLEMTLGVMDKDVDVLNVIIALKKLPVITSLEADMPDESHWIVPLETKEVAAKLEVDLMDIFTVRKVQNAKIHLLASPDVGLAIAQTASDLKTDILVSGCRGIGTLEKLLSGSTSDTLLHNTQSAMIIVQQSSDVPALPLERPLHFVVAYDGSESARIALGKAGILGRPGDKLSVVTVVADPPSAEARAEMDSITEDFKQRKMDVEYDVIQGGDPSDEIVRYVTEREPHLLVTGSRGLNALQRLFLGSVSETVFSRLPNTPVLIVKKPA